MEETAEARAFTGAVLGAREQISSTITTATCYTIAQTVSTISARNATTSMEISHMVTFSKGSALAKFIKCTESTIPYGAATNSLIRRTARRST